jgi:hypothetical protein
VLVKRVTSAGTPGNLVLAAEKLHGAPSIGLWRDAQAASARAPDGRRNRLAWTVDSRRVLVINTHLLNLPEPSGRAGSVTQG